MKNLHADIKKQESIATIERTWMLRIQNILHFCLYDYKIINIFFIHVSKFDFRCALRVYVYIAQVDRAHYNICYFN